MACSIQTCNTLSNKISTAPQTSFDPHSFKKSIPRITSCIAYSNTVNSVLKVPRPSPTSAEIIYSDIRDEPSNMIGKRLAVTNSSSSSTQQQLAWPIPSSLETQSFYIVDKPVSRKTRFLMKKNWPSTPLLDRTSSGRIPLPRHQHLHTLRRRTPQRRPEMFDKLRVVSKGTSYCRKRVRAKIEKPKNTTGQQDQACQPTEATQVVR